MLYLLHSYVVDLSKNENKSSHQSSFSLNLDDRNKAKLTSSYLELQAYNAPQTSSDTSGLYKLTKQTLLETPAGSLIEVKIFDPRYHKQTPSSSLKYKPFRVVLNRRATGRVKRAQSSSTKSRKQYTESKQLAVRRNSSSRITKLKYQTASLFPPTVVGFYNPSHRPSLSHSRQTSLLSNTSSVWDTDCLVAADSFTGKLPPALSRFARGIEDSDLTDDLINRDPFTGLQIEVSDTDTTLTQSSDSTVKNCKFCIDCCRNTETSNCNFYEIYVFYLFYVCSERGVSH